MAGLYDRLYAQLPVGLQSAAISLYGWRWQRRRFGGVFAQELRGFKDREDFQAHQWEAYQTLALRRLLVHAFETVPYYRRVYGARGLRLEDLARFELSDLKRLPFLEKEDLRRFGKTDLVSTKPEPGGQFFASSGSTGTPTSLLYSHAFHQRWSAAFEARIRHWAGLDRHTPRGMIGGRRVVPEADSPPPYYRYNWVERQTYFSAYHIGPATVAGYLEGMRRHRVAYMTGYAMSNYFLARHAQQLGLEGPPLRAVITSSEKLTPEMRAVFRDVYGCATFDSYSGVEACGLISENAWGELVVSPDVGVLEILGADGQEVGAGEVGEVVSTGLLNFDQPLIRYRIGDQVRRAPAAPSKSGTAMPRVQEIVGRLEDRVVGPDGREMVRFHGVFVNVPHLSAGQVVQETRSRLTLRVVTEPGFSAQEESLMASRVRSQLGDVEVAFEHVSELPRTANGKIQAVISRLPPEAPRS